MRAPLLRRVRPLLTSLALVVGSVAVVAATTSPATAAGVDDIRINEVESNGDAVGDWVELTNVGTAIVDISGMKLLDNDNAHTFVVVPSGTSLAPGGYYAIYVDAPQQTPGFGLGSTDTVRLYASSATAGTDPTIDTYGWTGGHASTTYGRCPDGLGANTGNATVTTAPTRGAENACPTKPLAINEVESNGDATHGDWIEVRNNSASAIDLSGYYVLDNDDTHTPATFPSGTMVQPGGYATITTDVGALGFGLGSIDTARLFDTGGTLLDAYTWSAHAPVTYARCPDGTGTFAAGAISTYNAANDCSSPVKINEVESNGGSPDDWVELKNVGVGAIDISGYVITDNTPSDPTHRFTIPSGTSLAGGAYFTLDVTGLGGADSARLFAADGTTLLDSYDWTAHAATTYGRCPDGTGAFTTTQVSTKNGLNNCPGDLVTSPWPGGSSVATVDTAGYFGADLSGLAYEGNAAGTPGTLWAVRNGTGSLFALQKSGDIWTSSPIQLHYPLGAGGTPDSEGVTLGAGGSTLGGVYVSTERDGGASGVSRPSILRFDVSSVPGATSLDATHEWNLAADFPGLGANQGLEGIAFVPDSYWTGTGLVDQHTGVAYDPATYPDHRGGLFVVGVEGTGHVYGYALDHASGAFQRVFDVATGFPIVADVSWEPSTQKLWVVCDETCSGRTATFEVNGSGVLAATTYYERPTGMPNIGNEGFALAPSSECVGGVKPVWWSDDGNAANHALRQGTVACTGRIAQTVTFTSTAPGSAVVGQTYDVAATGGPSGNPVAFGAAPASVCTVADATVSFVGAGSCVITASQGGDADHLGDSAAQSVTVAKAASATAVTVTPDTIVAEVTVLAPGVATPTGEVTFLVDGHLAGTADLVDGTATLDADVPPGALRTVYAFYPGDDAVSSSQDTTVRDDPTITAEVTSSNPPTASGWYVAPVTVTFTCVPHGAPLAEPCPDPVKLDTSGADQSVDASVEATDGGVGTVSVSGLDLDLDDPTVRVAGVAAGATYPASEPTPRCVGKDATSGIVSCVLTTVRSGLKVTVTARAVDAAGHTATDVVSYRVPAFQVVGARYVDGQYVVERGAGFKVRALVAGSPTPQLLGPFKKVASYAGSGTAMKKGAAAGGGLVTWVLNAKVPGSSNAKAWKVGVKVGSRTTTILLKVTG